MINLIKNEYIKIGIFKLIIIPLIFILVIVTMHIIDIDISSKLLSFIPYIALSIVSLFGGILSSEYQSGTIRFYLTKPHKRSKILISKLLTIIFYTLFLIIVVLIICILTVHSVNIELIKDYLYCSIPLIFINILTIFLSSIFRSQSLSTIILIIFLFTSNLLTELFLLLKFRFIIYTPLPYIDFTIFNNTEIVNEFNNIYNINLNLNNGIIIILLYSLLTLTINIIIFNKKDIKC